jgi:hypothetical protein
MSHPEPTKLQQASADLYRALQGELARPSASIDAAETAALFDCLRTYIGRNLGTPETAAFVRGAVS